ncbi:guanylate-binding protein 2-like [Megalops cyprinoides]|uniref:guanylate-binding protein 2-like n=1 Tax=Megalops cyprinoides TaxID=118141 RepID=UPI001863D2CE|nr:guanylate-binding protein 2-like [Megalops cyprinoides]
MLKKLEMPKPVCLIESMQKNDFQVNQEALDILSSIKQPVVVVAIVGKYRTGKSYLMNRLAGKHTGFSLGSTIQSETKGIWMWCVTHPCRENHTLVLLDTEGLGDVEKGDQRNDTWIFALAVLLSSTLIYNSIGTIDDEAVMTLHYVTELSKHIKISSGKSEKEASVEFAHVFPHFVWAVRDFMLELELNGKIITADEYLENSLKIKVEASNRKDPRNYIQKYFPSRKCFVFDQPASKAKLKKIEQLSDNDLDPAFVEQTSHFCNYIFTHSCEKIIQGETTVTGSMLGGLAKIYVDTIRSGEVPCLENAVEALAEIENSTACEQSFTLYRQLLGERVKLHTETQEELSTVHEVCLEKALQFFLAHSFKDEDLVYQKKLKVCIIEEYERICKENEKLSRDHCIALLQQLWKHLNPESFMRPKGYADYQLKLDEIIKEYRAAPGKGITVLILTV